MSGIKGVIKYISQLLILSSFSIIFLPIILGLRHGPDSYGRQQWGIFRNGRKPDGATPRER